MAFSLERTVGRLCELRVEEGLSLRDMTAFRARLATLFQSGTGRVVICSDLTRCEKIPPEVVAALVTIGKIDNPRVERHGMLIIPTHPLGAQMETVVTGSGSDARRIFYTVRPLASWLSEQLDAAEQAQLTRFLAGAAL